MYLKEETPSRPTEGFVFHSLHNLLCREKFKNFKSCITSYFWYLDKLVKDRWKILADLNSRLWISKFFVSKCFLFNTYNEREKINSELKGKISIF